MSEARDVDEMVAQWRSEMARLARGCPDCTSDPAWMGFVRTGGRELGGQWHYRVCDHPRARKRKETHDE